MISDYDYDITSLKLKRGTDMVTTVFADNKDDLVDLAYRVHQWEGAFHSFEEDEAMAILANYGQVRKFLHYRQ